MKIAITGGTGFIGRNLARRLLSSGHEVVIVSRGVDNRDPEIRSAGNLTFKPVGIGDVESLAEAFAGCEVVAHCAGINREFGDQTYQSVHTQGTANVLEAAKRVGVRKIALTSFLRANPEGSAYSRSKWEAEELVRAGGLDYTIFKVGVTYGHGDHLLDHMSQALHTFPVFLLVGFWPTPMRPLAVEDLAELMEESLTSARLSRATVPVMGPEELDLKVVASRIAGVVGKRPFILPAPIWMHYLLAWAFERTMVVPLIALSQVRILSETLAEGLLTFNELPSDLQPKTPFTEAQIRKGLPKPGSFGVKDCLCRATVARRRAV